MTDQESGISDRGSRSSKMRDVVAPLAIGWVAPASLLFFQLSSRDLFVLGACMFATLIFGGPAAFVSALSLKKGQPKIVRVVCMTALLMHGFLVLYVAIPLAIGAALTF